MNEARGELREAISEMDRCAAYLDELGALIDRLGISVAQATKWNAQVQRRNRMSKQRLSHRERQVVDGFMRSLTLAAIAAEIGCATSTAATHRTRLYRKFGASDRVGLLRALGVIQREDATVAAA